MIYNKRKLRVWKRHHRALWLGIQFGLLIGLIYIICFYRPVTKYSNREIMAPVPSPTPKWIETKNGGEYREDICNDFEFFEVTINGEKEQICPKPTEKPTKVVPTTSPNAPQRPTSGKASYYSVAGCLGCSDNRQMANGEILDDTKLTVAYNHAPLNTYIHITNVANNKTVTAKITDRGGFEKYNKIADLSVATKNALGCGDVCNVKLAF